MNPNSWWRRSAYFLIVVVGFGLDLAGQDSSPENSRVLGRLAFGEGRYSDAERELRLALEGFLRAGNSLEIARTLGDLAAGFVVHGRHSEAERLLDRALDMMPKDVAHPRDTSRL